MSWVSFIVTLLKLAVSLTGWLKERRQIKAGEDALIASAALAVLEKTQKGKELRQYIDSLGDEDALSVWERMLKHE